jgi:hypothetical protein
MFNFLKRIEKKQEEPIHPDFKNKDGFWFWNYTDFGKYIKESRKDLKIYNPNGIVKVAFPFDDVSLLNDCPFMCKIGENISSLKDTKYFGIAYAYEDEIEKLEEFGKKFSRHEVIRDLDYRGEKRI